MSLEQIKKIRARIAAKLENLDNAQDTAQDTDELIELTLEELYAISGGRSKGSWHFDHPCGPGCYKLD